MKKILACFAIFLFVKISAQGKPTIEFNYDKSGNLTERKVQAIRLGRFSKPDLHNDSISKPILFKVSPNPSSTVLNIETEGKTEITNARIELVTLSGQLIHTIERSDEINNSIDVSNIKSGLYLLIITYSNKDREVHKIIIND